MTACRCAPRYAAQRRQRKKTQEQHSDQKRQQQQQQQKQQAGIDSRTSVGANKPALHEDMPVPAPAAAALCDTTPTYVSARSAYCANKGDQPLATVCPSIPLAATTCNGPASAAAHIHARAHGYVLMPPAAMWAPWMQAGGAGGPAGLPPGLMQPAHRQLCSLPVHQLAVPGVVTAVPMAMPFPAAAPHLHAPAMATAAARAQAQQRMAPDVLGTIASVLGHWCSGGGSNNTASAGGRTAHYASLSEQSAAAMSQQQLQQKQHAEAVEWEQAAARQQSWRSPLWRR